MKKLDTNAKMYCVTECELGKRKQKEFLEKNNSAYDAALDMIWFVEDCMRTCPRFNKAEEANKSDC